jgi:hypothetical protein
MAMELEELPAQLSRRNWIVLGVLLVVSLPFAHWPFSLGILSGGLLSIVAFAWLHRSLRRLFSGGGSFRYNFGYLLRLLALAVTLAVLIAVIKIHPVGLVIGLSVVVINLLWLTVQRALM